MLARLHTVHNDRENGNEDPTAITGGVRCCIVECHRLFESFLKRSVHAVAIPVFLLQRVTHAIFLLVTMEEIIKPVVDEGRLFIHVQDFKTQLYLDGLVSVLRQLAAQRPNRPAIGFATLLTVLQNWMRQRSRGSCSLPFPVSSESHESRQRLQAENCSTSQASLHPPDQVLFWTPGSSHGDASETYAHDANVEGTSGASASRNESRYDDLDQSIVRSATRSALRLVLAEDDITTEYLGGFLELAENSVRDDADGA